MSKAASLVAVAVLLSLGAAAGCGGSEEDEDPYDSSDPLAVVERYQRALEDQDVSAICRELIVPDTFEEAESEHCESRFAVALVASAEREDFDEHEFGDVIVEENRATVENLTTGGFMELTRSGGRWYLVLVR